MPAACSRAGRAKFIDALRPGAATDRCSDAALAELSQRAGEQCHDPVAARYLNADVTLVHLIIAALVPFTCAGVAVYIAAWLVIPDDGED